MFFVSYAAQKVAYKLVLPLISAVISLPITGCVVLFTPWEGTLLDVAAIRCRGSLPARRSSRCAIWPKGFHGRVIGRLSRRVSIDYVIT